MAGPGSWWTRKDEREAKRSAARARVWAADTSGRSYLEMFPVTSRRGVVAGLAAAGKPAKKANVAITKGSKNA